MEMWSKTEPEFRDYLLTTDHSQQTVRTYVTNLHKFWRWCAQRETRPYDVDATAIRGWLADRMLEVSTQRAYNDLAALKLYYAWLREIGRREDNPTANIRVKRTKALPTEPLDHDDFNQLMKGCRDERDRLILLVLAATGMRISELAALTYEDIDWNRGIIRFFGKGGKERRIAPNPEVLGRLRAFGGMFASGPVWLSKRAGRPLSAHQIRKIIYDLAERAKVRDVHPHRFRALFATEYIEQFGDIQALQGVMGHESIETTARYSEYTRERRGLEQMRQLRIGTPSMN